MPGIVSAPNRPLARVAVAQVTTTSLVHAASQEVTEDHPWGMEGMEGVDRPASVEVSHLSAGEVSEGTNPELHTTWSANDEYWSQFFETFDSDAIVYNEDLALWKKCAGRGLRVKEGVEWRAPKGRKHRGLRTPSAQGELITLAEANRRRDNGEGAYLSTTSGGMVIDGAKGRRLTPQSAFSMVNRARDSYTGECSDAGEERPRKEWIRVKPNMDMVRGAGGAGAHYRVRQDGVFDESRECFAPYGSTVVMSKHGKRKGEGAEAHAQPMDGLVPVADGMEDANCPREDPPRRARREIYARPLQVDERTEPEAAAEATVDVVAPGFQMEPEVEAVPRRQLAFMASVEFLATDSAGDTVTVPAAGTRPPGWDSEVHNAWTSWWRFLHAVCPDRMSPEDLVLATYPEDGAQRRVADWVKALHRAGGDLDRLRRELRNWSQAVSLVGATKSKAHANRERNPYLDEALKGAAPTAEAIQTKVLKSISSRRDPLDTSTIQECWTNMWTNTDWTSSAGMDARGEHVYLLLGYAFGLRKSNATQLSKENPHGLLAREVAFELAKVREPISAGCEPELREALGMDATEDISDKDPRVAKVQGVRFRFLTGKPTRTAGAKGIRMGAVDHWIRRGSTTESQAVDCFTLWELHRQNPGIRNHFLSRRFFTPNQKGGGHWRAKNIQSKTAIVKVKAAVAKAGGDPSKVSSRCLRVTLSTNAEEAGVPQEQLNTCGGWVPGSTVASEVYSRATTYNGLSIIALEASEGSEEDEDA